MNTQLCSGWTVYGSRDSLAWKRIYNKWWRNRMVCKLASLVKRYLNIMCAFTLGNCITSSLSWKMVGKSETTTAAGTSRHVTNFLTWHSFVNEQPEKTSVVAVSELLLNVLSLDYELGFPRFPTFCRLYTFIFSYFYIYISGKMGWCNCQLKPFT